MQRAAASTPPSTPQSQLRTPNNPPSKRQKVSAAPSTATPPSDLQLLQAALTEEEGKREKAIERLAEEAGETRWVLSTVNEQGNGVGGLQIATAGYSDIDQEAWGPTMVGRRSFGNFNKGLEVSFVIMFSFHVLMMLL